MHPNVARSRQVRTAPGWKSGPPQPGSGPPNPRISTVQPNESARQTRQMGSFRQKTSPTSQAAFMMGPLSSGGLGRVAIDGRFRFLDFRQGAAIIELQAAKTAVIQLAAANARRQVPESELHLVDMVPRFQSAQPVGPAPRTTAFIAPPVAEAGNRLDLPAFRASIQCDISKSLHVGTMNTFQPSPALSALRHDQYCLYAICDISTRRDRIFYGQFRRQYFSIVLKVL
jgi:hypothetical protein